jgi:signal transduction histidine kinase
LSGPKENPEQSADPAKKLLENPEAALNAIQGIIRIFSHDLRTPLTVLRGDAEVALLKPRSAEEYQRVLSSNLAEVDRISRLVDDVFALIQGISGSLKLSFHAIKLNELVSQLADQCLKEVSQKGICLTIKAKNEIVIHADQHRLEQLLARIIGNTLDWAPERSKVEVSVEELEKKACVFIRDHGAGIPADQLDLIFDPFIKSEALRTSLPQGKRVVFSLCKLIAEAHGGSLEVESRVGKGSGTCFTLCLPKSPEIA